jgi:hypothetical protein
MTPAQYPSLARTHTPRTPQRVRERTSGAGTRERASERATIRVTLQDTGSPVPVASRVRMLLKTALRRDKLKCVDVREVIGATASDATIWQG